MSKIARRILVLLAHNVNIFQHPLYWYATPAILKEWQDLVLEHGFAYGAEGRVHQHINDWTRLLKALRDDRIDINAARELPKTNINLDKILKEL